MTTPAVQQISAHRTVADASTQSVAPGRCLTSAVTQANKQKGITMSRWELTVNDPNVDHPVVTEHDTYDEMLSHIRATYDPSGYYADEGTGSMQNLLAGEGYEFHYHQIDHTPTRTATIPQEHP